MKKERLKIGISACFFYPDPARLSFANKTLQYVEQSMTHWLMAGGALPVMIPSPVGETARGDIGFDDYAQWLDGLVLHGGADVWPGSYGETPLHERWSGDRKRDEYDQALVKAFVNAGKPVFGVCRGMQLINVAYGGTLLQDIPTQRPDASTHRDGEVYDQHFHAVEIVPHTRLEILLAGENKLKNALKINSIHHQGIKDLASGFVVEARCPDDGIIEAIRHTGPAYIAAVQWHPEFHHSEQDTLDDTRLLTDFLDAAQVARSAKSNKAKTKRETST